MKYYINTKSDGVNGGLVSIGIVREDDVGLYAITNLLPKDPWTIEHVDPVLKAPSVPEEHVYILKESTFSLVLRVFIANDSRPTFISNSVQDVVHMTRFLTTGFMGEPIDHPHTSITFKVMDLNLNDCIPEGYVKHHAYWDAKALEMKMVKRQKK